MEDKKMDEKNLKTKENYIVISKHKIKSVIGVFAIVGIVAGLIIAMVCLAAHTGEQVELDADAASRSASILYYLYMYDGKIKVDSDFTKNSDGITGEFTAADEYTRRKYGNCVIRVKYHKDDNDKIKSISGDNDKLVEYMKLKLEDKMTSIIKEK